MVGLVIATVLVICAGLGVAGVILAVNVAKNIVASGDTPDPQPGGPRVTSGPAEENDGGDDKDNGGDGEILLEVTGDGPVAIFYGDGGGASENLREVELPWRTTLPRQGPLQVVTVLVTRVSLTDGEITCRISAGGVQLQEQTKDGKFAIATCITAV
jgi:hypothetical protein